MFTRKRSKYAIIPLVLLAGLAALALAQLLPESVVDLKPSARQEVAQALDHASDSGQYQYSTTIVQTLHPILSLENVGRTARTEQYVIDGEMDVPADLMMMQLTAPNREPLQIKVDNGVGYGRASADGRGQRQTWLAIFCRPAAIRLAFWRRLIALNWSMIRRQTNSFLMNYCQSTMPTPSRAIDMS